MRNIFLTVDKGSTKSQIVQHFLDLGIETIRCCHCRKTFKVHRDLVDPRMLCPHCNKNPWW